MTSNRELYNIINYLCPDLRSSDLMKWFYDVLCFKNDHTFSTKLHHWTGNETRPDENMEPQSCGPCLLQQQYSETCL